MSSAPMTDEENIVVLFKTFEDLKRDEDKIIGEYEAEWAKAYSVWDLTRAVIDDDKTELAKFAAAPELALIKADVAASVKKYKDTAVANAHATAVCAASLRAAVEKRNNLLFGYSALAKRSLRFASAHASRNYGPGAASLPPAS
jgi:hypothetical protein